MANELSLEQKAVASRIQVFGLSTREHQEPDK